jgi:acetylornithine deacetylase/succinyl-diaminopimelate desuccinylase-like protein
LVKQMPASVAADPALVELVRDLIRFDTTNPPGNERECVAYLHQRLTQAGCQTQVLAQAQADHRPNLVARLPGRGQAPPLLMYGHLDVVTTAGQQWQQPPFAANLLDGYVWGRGALDMKGGVAMMLSAFLRARADPSTEGLPGDVILALVGDEEAGGQYGAGFLVEQHPHLFEGVRYAIGEFGGFSTTLAGRRFYPIMVSEKQTCRLQVTVRGPGGHGSLSHRGGAMAALAQVLRRLDRRRLPVHVTPPARLMLQALAAHLPFPQGTVLRQLLNPAVARVMLPRLGSLGRTLEPLLRHTVNATIVRGGEQVNVLPSEITLTLDGRLLPGYGPGDLMAELRPMLGDAAELTLLRHVPGPAKLDLGLFDTLAGILRQADPQGIPVPMLLPAATDARYFARLGIQTYGFLPMRLEPGFDFLRTIHGPNERIPVDALTFGAQAIYQLLRSFGPGDSIAKTASLH